MNQQTALLDLGAKEISAMFADATTPVLIANNPLHWKAHKLQIMLNRLETQMINNPAQFNSSVYIRTLDAFAALMEVINGQSGESTVLESTAVGDGLSEPARPPEASQGKPNGLDSRISADNPFARKRLSAA